MYNQLQENINDFSSWKSRLQKAVVDFQQYLKRNEIYDDNIEEIFLSVLESLKNDKVVVAFVAEFSRGKTELINALFFSEYGVRLLPSTPGRTTMCPVEIMYDAERDPGSHIRLLPIETRLDKRSLAALRKDESAWEVFELDSSSPLQMQDTLTCLADSKRVNQDTAEKLGLYDPELSEVDEDGLVEIPRWRHAIINFPHSMLERGLVVLDTPGLNALGSEPELTLNLLSSAHVVLFLLAADTGVTKSDMDMWRHHIQGAARSGNDSVALILNKIDTICDGLMDDERSSRLIDKQVADVAAILKVPKNRVFPISAKRALFGRIRDNYQEVQASRILELESYLSAHLIENRKRIVLKSVHNNIGSLVTNTIETLHAQINSITTQLSELEKLEYKNETMLESMIEETQKHQALYVHNVEHFQNVRGQYIAMVKQMLAHIAPEVVDNIIRKHTVAMESSLTTMGMKDEMHRVFVELEKLVQESIRELDKIQAFVQESYDFFGKQDEYYANLKAPKIHIDDYMDRLKAIFDEGEQFRRSMTSTLLEQHMVVHRLYTTVLQRARKMLNAMYKNTARWSTISMAPLINRIKEHKTLIENKLAVLRKVSESKGETEQEIAQLKAQLEPLEKNLAELNAIEEALRLPESDDGREENAFEAA